MRRLALLLPLVALLAACGSLGGAPAAAPPPLAGPADPQTHEVGWRESFGPGSRVLRFEVRSVTVLDDGWTAEIALENATQTTFDLGANPLRLSFGLMLFASGTLESLNEATRVGNLPALRRARTIEPEPPERLVPGQRWTATLSAPGSLPAGAWARVVFGTLAPIGEPPAWLEEEGVGELLLWITDHAVRLR